MKCSYAVILAFILNMAAVTGATSGIRPCSSSSSGRFSTVFGALPLTHGNRPYKGFHSRWDPHRKLLSGRCGTGEGQRTRRTQEGRKQVMILHVINNIGNGAKLLSHFHLARFYAVLREHYTVLNSSMRDVMVLLRLLESGPCRTSKYEGKVKETAEGWNGAS